MNDETEDHYYITDINEQPAELVEAYFDKEALDYIHETVWQTLKAYETFGWEYKPDPKALYNYLVSSAYRVQADKQIAHTACWRIQIQAAEGSPRGFEILLNLGDDRHIFNDEEE